MLQKIKQKENMINKEVKEAYRLFFLIKGHINITPEMALASADGYFKRLWYDGGDGAPLYDYDEDFEKVWEAKHGKQENTRPVK